VQSCLFDTGVRKDVARSVIISRVRLEWVGLVPLRVPLHCPSKHDRKFKETWLFLANYQEYAR